MCRENHLQIIAIMFLGFYQNLYSLVKLDCKYIVQYLRIMGEGG